MIRSPMTKVWSVFNKVTIITFSNGIFLGSKLDFVIQRSMASHSKS